ncbi:unnamed protein product [Symbiodinium natans]|uniref:NAD(+) kinase n=1 Tax=Symbiodinium natans TaxID=878477 RepID=A0A812T8D5_9DINO|nr:unnamed protein product [Symbiodinium natans]
MEAPEVPTLALNFSLESPQQRWRNVLAQSNKEMLQELLASASGADSRTIEEIAMTVADRVLASEPVQSLLEADGALSPLVKPMHSEDLLKGPQLEDIQVTEWNIWSGKVKDAKTAEEELRKSSKCSPQGARSHSVDFEMRELEHRMPEQVSCSSEDGELRNRMHAGLELRTTTQQYTWMRWEGKPKAVLLVAKQGDRDVTRKLRDIASWIDSQGCYVVLEPDLWDEVQGRSPGIKPEPSPRKVCWCADPCDCKRMVSKAKREETTFAPKWQWGGSEGLPPGFAERCRTWTPKQDKLEEHIDLVISLGGDGTLCWTSGLFAGAMPPVIAFAAGSLGFLTPFPLSDWMSVLMPVLGSKSEVAPPLQLVCRMRFQMRLSRHEEDPESSPAIPVQSMNEVLVHRGASPHLVKLDVCVNDKSVTMVQGDGLIIATPTGSTAYSLAAGGSMMHPAVPGIILTPVCPHSLSFRPVVLPDSAVVKVRVPTSARSSRVMVAVDGKDRIELKRGDSIEVSVSQYPLPTICRASVTRDWFRSVNEALQWNRRLEQKGGKFQK